MKVTKIVAVAGALLGAAVYAGGAMAADADFHPGDKLIRMRALGVIPDVNTKNWANNAGLTNSTLDADVTATVVPELDLTYFLTSRLAVEVIAGVAPVSLKGKGSLSGSMLGDAWLLPPTVTLQYHLGNISGINPYVGVGANYTVFFNQHASATGLALNKLKIDNAWGLAVQGGFDMPLGGNLFLNVDVKKIFLDTDVMVSNAAGGYASTKADLDPWLVGVGVGLRLGGPAAPLK